MNQKTILVIDDEPDTITYFTSILEDAGYKTLSADNGDKGIEMLEKNKVDLITLDVSMPEMSGVKYYRTLKEKENWKDIPIIMITGVSEDFKKFVSTRKQVPPPDGYLSKPVEDKDLIAEVKKLLN
jgi:CheY-like chemotaxis protein